MIKKMKNSLKWKIIILLRRNKKDRIVYVKNSSEPDPEVAWSSVFSDWKSKHRNLQVSGITDKGLIVKDKNNGKKSELIINYTRIDPVS